MSDPIAPLAPPATVEVVAMKVAEQLMSDMYRRIAQLEARLELVEREADEAEQQLEATEGHRGSFVEVAQRLLERADELRTTAGTLAHGAGDGPEGDALVLRLLTNSEDPPRDHLG